MTHELIAQPDADKDRNDCARNRDDSAKHNLFHEFVARCARAVTLLSIPLAIRTNSGRRRICWAIRRASSLDGRLEKVRRVFAVHPHDSARVCFEAQTGKHLLILNLTAFDPFQTLRLFRRGALGTQSV